MPGYIDEYSLKIIKTTAILIKSAKYPNLFHGSQPGKSKILKKLTDSMFNQYLDQIFTFLAIMVRTPEFSAIVEKMHMLRNL